MVYNPDNLPKLQAARDADQYETMAKTFEAAVWIGLAPVFLLAFLCLCCCPICCCCAGAMQNWAKNNPDSAGANMMMMM